MDSDDEDKKIEELRRRRQAIIEQALNRKDEATQSQPQCQEIMYVSLILAVSITKIVSICRNIEDTFPQEESKKEQKAVSKKLIEFDMFAENVEIHKVSKSN